MSRHIQDWSEIGNYTLVEASAYLHIPVNTLRYWTIGDTTDGRLLSVNFSNGIPILSFKNLVECYVLELIRHVHNIHLSTVRYSLRIALEKFPSEHPFADYEVSTRGKKVYLGDFPLIDVSTGGQYAFAEVLLPFLKRVERSKGIAQRLYPFMRKSEMRGAIEDISRIVLIDPGISFGMPVLAGSRVTTATLASRYRGGDSISTLARDYGRKKREIKEALVWERAKKAA